MQITRWDPFTELGDIQQRLNRFFAERPLKTATEGFAEWTPAVDIQETEGEFIVKADLPDVRKEDVKVQVQDGMLVIDGERRKEVEEKGKRFHKIEREYGKFIRRFALPAEVDGTKTQAEFKDGVLRVHLPKSPAARPTVVEVKVG
jgi:HSP20 family protein